MKKSFLLWLIVIISLLTLTSCKHQTEENTEKQPSQSQITFEEKSDNSDETETAVKNSYVLQSSDIAQFPGVPDWRPEEMEEQIGRGYIVPQFLIEVYEKSGLDGESMTIQLPNGKRIAKLCVDNYGQYYFLGTFVGKAALFKNDNESITVLQEATSDRKFIGYSYYNDGNWNLKVIHMDYMDGAEGKLVDYAGDFSIIYYPETNEVVCIRYGEEIGPRTKIDSNLLRPGSFSYEWKDGTTRYNDGFNKLKIGFINEGRLIYPIILKNGEEISFHLYGVAVFDENVEETGKIEVDGIQYGIYQGKAYTIQNATKRESVLRCNRLIVEDTEIHLQVKEIEETLSVQETEETSQVQETEIPIKEMN